MEELDEKITELTKKKIGWIMELLEIDQPLLDLKTRVKRAVWNLADEIKLEIKQSINQAQVYDKQNK